MIKKTIIYNYKKGFALPTVMIVSIVMLMVLLSALTSASAVRVALVSQYYNKLSQTAANAGVVYAKACLSANGGVPQWSDANPLKPDTDCTGTQLAACPISPADAACHFVAVSDNARSAFKVNLPTLYAVTGIAKDITVVATTNLLRTSDNSIWRQYTTSSKVVLSNKLTPVTAIAAITGTPQVSQTLTAGATTPADATVSYQWQSATIPGGVYTNIAGATSSTYVLTSSEFNKYIKIVITGIGDYIGAQTSVATTAVSDPNWIAGIAATAMAGKYVRSTNLGSTYQYKTALTAVASPQGATGLDPNYSSNMSLVSPQTNPGVDFSAYPAQNACKAIGGRLPNMQELTAIYTDRVAYGNNFQADNYWSSTEFDGVNVYDVNFSDGNVYNGNNKTSFYYVRCVMDSPWIAIGTQTWATSNLNVGTMITGVTEQTNNGGTNIVEKYCYNDTESNCMVYGGLYQWDEAMNYKNTEGAQGICPAGSHIPTYNEWMTLVTYFGSETTAGAQLKFGKTSGLNMPIAGGRNSDGSFYNMSTVGYLWTSSESGALAWLRFLYSGNDNVDRNAGGKAGGFSVRCVGN